MRLSGVKKAQPKARERKVGGLLELIDELPSEASDGLGHSTRKVNESTKHVQTAGRQHLPFPRAQWRWRTKTALSVEEVVPPILFRPGMVAGGNSFRCHHQSSRAPSRAEAGTPVS